MTRKHERIQTLTPDFLRRVPEAVEEVYALVIADLRNAAVSQGADQDEAEDIAQEAFLYALDNVKAERMGQATLRGLMLSKAAWLTRDARRKQSNLVELLYHEAQEELEDVDQEPPIEPASADYGAVDFHTPEEEIIGANLRVRMERTVIEAHGEQAWDIYYASVVNGTPHTDIAERFEIHPNTVTNTVSRCNATLKAMLLGSGST